jgi:hypothetical protein
VNRRNFRRGGKALGGDRGLRRVGGATGYRARNGDLVLSSFGPDVGKVPINPTLIVRNAINDALDPTKAPSKPKTFAQMTDEEKAEMRRLYEKKP